MEDKNIKMNRIELRAHTKMTESAGLISAADLVTHAREQGMDAVAIDI